MNAENKNTEAVEAVYIYSQITSIVLALKFNYDAMQQPALTKQPAAEPFITLRPSNVAITSQSWGM